jgi:hypothetical protein
MAAVGDLSNVELLNNKVLVGIDIEPETAGTGQGVGVAGHRRSCPEERQHRVQGRAGDRHVLPRSGRRGWRLGRIPAGDARRIRINGVDCRMVEDTLLDMVIESPEVITHR